MGSHFAGHYSLVIVFVVGICASVAYQPTYSGLCHRCDVPRALEQWHCCGALMLPYYKAPVMQGYTCRQSPQA